MTTGEHVPGHDDDGPICPRCECPDVRLLFADEQDLTRRNGKRELVIRRKRQCQNHNCLATFWTIERRPL